MPLATDPDRITIEPGRMKGRPCVRGLRVTVATIMACSPTG